MAYMTTGALLSLMRRPSVLTLDPQGRQCMRGSQQHKKEENYGLHGSGRRQREHCTAVALHPETPLWEPPLFLKNISRCLGSAARLRELQIMPESLMATHLQCLLAIGEHWQHQGHWDVIGVFQGRRAYLYTCTRCCIFRGFIVISALPEHFNPLYLCSYSRYFRLLLLSRAFEYIPALFNALATHRFQQGLLHLWLNKAGVLNCGTNYKTNVQNAVLYSGRNLCFSLTTLQ